MIGKKISHYEIIEKLGEGGMGVVFKACDTNLDRHVALKFLPPNITPDEEAIERFKREAKAAAALNHPNIVTIHEIGEHEGQLFIAMELVEGNTLRVEINEHRISNDDIGSIAEQVCEGLGKAHEKGIVHRDIKPENILIDSNGRVKILDFGLAKLKGAANLTKEMSTLGTAKYLSPEQARGVKVDNRSDIWSVGVVLYEMLTGQLPFKGEYESAVLYSIVNEIQEPVTALENNVPIELEKIINKCLEKDPANRFANMGELNDDLQRLKNQSESAGTPSKNGKQKRHSKSVLTSTAILSIIIPKNLK